MTTKRFTDEEVVAFLDGTLPDDLNDAFEAELAQSEVLQARVNALSIPINDIRAEFDKLLVPDMPANLPHSARPKRVGPAGLVAMAAVIAVVAFALGMFVRSGGGQGDWVTAVANYQSLYVQDTLAIPTPDQDDANAMLATVSAALGQDLAPLRALEGLEFKRAQVLGVAGQPLIQLAYVTEAGVPVAVCLTPDVQMAETPQNDTLFGLDAAYAAKGGLGVLVIGGQDAGMVSDTLTTVLTRL